MPAVSEAQRRYLYATKGAAWVKAHHFDNKGKLPAKKRRGKPYRGQALMDAHRKRKAR